MTEDEIAYEDSNAFGMPRRQVAVCDECGAPAARVTVSRTFSSVDEEGRSLDQVERAHSTYLRTSRSVVEVVYSCPTHENFAAEMLTAQRGITQNRYVPDELATLVSDSFFASRRKS